MESTRGLSREESGCDGGRLRNTQTVSVPVEISQFLFRSITGFISKQLRRVHGVQQKIRMHPEKVEWFPVEEDGSLGKWWIALARLRLTVDVPLGPWLHREEPVRRYSYVE